MADDPALDALGAVVADVSPGHARITLEVTADMVNSHGVCHGGVIFTLADAVMDYATNSAESPGNTSFAVHAEIDYLRPAFVGDRLIAKGATRQRWGRSSMVDATITKEADGVVVAEFRGRTRSAAR